MAIGQGDVPQAADETSQPIVATALLGTQVINIYTKAADESQAAYNEIVPPTYQPIAAPITTNYLGQPLL